MKILRIISAMGHLDEELVAEAVDEKKKERRRLPFLKWGGVAACLLVAAVAVLVTAPWREGGSESGFSASEESSRVPQYVFSGEEMAWEFPWEYKLLAEKYLYVVFEGAEYHSRGASLDVELLGQALGTCEASGEDVYTGKIYTEELEVFEIKGVSAKRLVAVGKAGDYAVYMNDAPPFPATLGEALEEYGLEEHLALSRFLECEGYGEKSYRVMEEDSFIWEVLARCGDAKSHGDLPSSWLSTRRYISFTATSRALGVYKRVLYVTEDGYLSTNIFDVGGAYFIGEEAAGEIIRYARENSAEAEFEPYEQVIAGTVTEIGEEYLLVDTTVLCSDPRDGRVYRVPLEELRIRRSVEFVGIKVGDAVAVAFRGEITEENVIQGAVSIERGKLVKGGVAVPE